MSPSTYPSEIERYYKRFYDKKEDRPSEDVCVLAHSNKVCVVTLTPEHKALQGGPIQSLEYVVETGGKKVGDVHGKRKLEAIKLKTGMPLCKITSADGTVYTVNSPVRGKLCELNDKLLNDFTLLDRMPETNGYLAIVLHNTCPDEEYLTYLLTAEQYSDGQVLSTKIGAQDTDENMVTDKTPDKTKKVELETIKEVDVPANNVNKKEEKPLVKDVNGTDEKGIDKKQETRTEEKPKKEDEAKEAEDIETDKGEDNRGKRKSRTKTSNRVTSKRSKK